MIRGLTSNLTGIVVLVIVAIVVVLLITAWQNRRHLARTERKQCRQCGALYPASAKFCGRCGGAF